jgi:hypothetical protein
MKWRSIAFLTLVAACTVASAQSQPPAAAAGSEVRAQPLILEKNEGELRTRRLHTDKSSVPASQFLLKVSPKNNGSQHLVMGTEELLPNARIAKHKHLIQDEILMIQTDRTCVAGGPRK